MKASSVSIEPAPIEKPLEREEAAVLRSQDARGAVTLTLNRPHAFNALSEAMLVALQHELEAIGEDESVRVVVLASEGKAFCAGHDLKEMRAKPSLDYYELVAMCDLAVAASTAKFAVSGVNLGLFCSAPGVALSRNILRKAAFEMLVTGELVNAEEAKVRGLINRVAEPDQLDAEVEKLVAAIIAKPRIAVALGKEFFYRQIELSIASAYKAAAQTMARNMMDEAALEGVQAFIDKRPASWPNHTKSP